MLSNATVIWASQALMLIPQFILVPYLLSTIGETSYGIYVLVWSLVESVNQFEKSLQSGVIKYSAGFMAQGRIDDVNKVISSSFVYSILLSIVAFCGTFLITLFYDDPNGQIGYSLIIVAIMFLCIFPLEPYIALIKAKQCYYVDSILGVISKYVSLAAIFIWFTLVRPSVESLIIIMAVMAILSRLAQIPIAYRFMPGLTNRPRLFNKASFRLIASFGAVTILASLCLAANATGVRWLMNFLASTSFVAHLAIMLLPASFLSGVIGSVTVIVMPATSAYKASENQKMLSELLVRGTRYSMILALAALFSAVLLMKAVLKVWVGSDYLFLVPYAIALTASSAYMITNSVAHHMLKGLGKLWTVLFVYFFGLLVVPFGLILLLYQNEYNPYIAVSAGLVAGHLMCGFLNIAFCTKAVHAKLKSVIIQAYIEPLVIAATAFLFVIGIISVVEVDGLIALACFSILYLLLFFIGCYVFITTAAERHQVKNMLQTAKCKIKSLTD